MEEYFTMLNKEQLLNKISMTKPLQWLPQMAEAMWDTLKLIQHKEKKYIDLDKGSWVSAKWLETDYMFTYEQVEFYVEMHVL